MAVENAYAPTNEATDYSIGSTTERGLGDYEIARGHASRVGKNERKGLGVSVNIGAARRRRSRRKNRGGMFPNNSKRAVYLHFACKSPDALPSSPNQPDSTASFSDIQVGTCIGLGHLFLWKARNRFEAGIERLFTLYKSFLSIPRKGKGENLLESFGLIC